jgi:glyceraldehyde 3-phosphate dehydrogenase
MTINIGINGFGRIGRFVFRSVMERKTMKVVAINEPFMSIDNMIYLLKYDSVHGTFPYGSIQKEKGGFSVDNCFVRVFTEKDPGHILWGSVDVKYVCESTGVFTSTEKAKLHFEGGAKKVILSAPPSDDTKMLVMGVNHTEYDDQTMHIISNASCTTTCLAPLVKILEKEFGIEEGLMTTVHAMTANQLTVDGPPRGGKDWRAGRCASQNIIPASTGAAKAVGKVIPELSGKLTGMAFRVPTPNVSVVDLTVKLKTPQAYSDIINVISNYKNSSLRGIIDLCYDPVVSQDFVDNPHSCIVDVNSGLALNDTFFKFVCWYDNEWGYSNRLVDMIHYMETKV